MEVAIITKDRQDKIPLALLGLLSQQLYYPTLRIFDNGENPFSDNPLAQNILDLLVAGYYWNVVVYRQNLSLVDSRQKALDECKSKYLLYLDDDVYMMSKISSNFRRDFKNKCWDDWLCISIFYRPQKCKRLL